MLVSETSLEGVFLIEPSSFNDDRGYFLEIWNQKEFSQHKIPMGSFVQDDISFSKAGTLRGLHFQHPHDQGKLVWVSKGRVLDIVVDVRRGSPSYGKHISIELIDNNHLQLWIPCGFAHGFLALEDTLFQYKCDNFYAPESAHKLLWSDPELNIRWPKIVKDYVISSKDAAGKLLSEFTHKELPDYSEPT